MWYMIDKGNKSNKNEKNDKNDKNEKIDKSNKINKRIKTAGSKILVLIIILTCIVGVYSNSFGESAKTDFYDIKGNWSEKALEALIEKGIINGMLVNGVAEIMPDRTISRAEFVKIVVKAFDLKPIIANTKTFKDYKKGAWYNDVLNTATSNLLIAGYPDGCFHPDNQVTNEQVAIILTRLRNQQLKATGKVIDDSWYATNVLSNVKTEFKPVPAAYYIPVKNATRAEAMTALYSFMNITGGAATKKPGQTAGGTVVGNSGIGNDPVSIIPPDPSAPGSSTGSTGNTGSTGSAGSTGSGNSSPEPAKTGVLGYNLTAAQGEILYFQIYAYALAELGGFDFKVSYDPNVAVATSVRSGSIKEGEYIKPGDIDMSQASIGTVLVRNQDTSAIKKGDGTLFTVVFRVQPGATGSTVVSMKSSTGNIPLLYTKNGDVISPVTCTEGKITVK